MLISTNSTISTMLKVPLACDDSQYIHLREAHCLEPDECFLMGNMMCSHCAQLAKTYKVAKRIGRARLKNNKALEDYSQSLQTKTLKIQCALGVAPVQIQTLYNNLQTLQSSPAYIEKKNVKYNKFFFVTITFPSISKLVDIVDNFKFIFRKKNWHSTNFIGLEVRQMLSNGEFTGLHAHIYHRFIPPDIGTTYVRHNSKSEVINSYFNVFKKFIQTKNFIDIAGPYDPDSPGLNGREGKLQYVRDQIKLVGDKSEATSATTLFRKQYKIPNIFEKNI